LQRCSLRDNASDTPEILPQEQKGHETDTHCDGYGTPSSRYVRHESPSPAAREEKKKAPVSGDNRKTGAISHIGVLCEPHREILNVTLITIP